MYIFQLNLSPVVYIVILLVTICLVLGKHVLALVNKLVLKIKDELECREVMRQETVQTHEDLMATPTVTATQKAVAADMMALIDSVIDKLEKENNRSSRTYYPRHGHERIA